MCDSKRQSTCAGFTLLELIVVLVIMVVLAAILTPMLSNLINEARVTRAELEVQNIGRAIRNFNQSTGKWPIFQSGVSITTSSSIYDVLAGPGPNPADSTASGWLTGAQGDLGDILDRNGPLYGTSGRFAWRGPYVEEVGQDPWGNAYLVNGGSLAFGVNRAGMVISAGPNGDIETQFTQNIGSGEASVAVGGDDIVFRLR